LEQPIVGLVLVSVGAIWAVRRRFFPQLPSPLPHGPDHPLLVEASQQARASLGRFRQLVSEGTGQPIVKVAYATDTGPREHIWAELVRWEGEGIDVRYANAPVSQQGPMPSEESRVLADVEDWAVVLPGGRLVGGFSQRAMIRMVREQHPKPTWGLRRRLKLKEARFVDA
jgi:uncharacterized protein YegJ (DUF2314 family)